MGNLKRTPCLGYVLLWFPLSSETFISREIQQLRSQNFPVHVYTMYGKRLAGISQEILNYDGPVTRFGSRQSLLLLFNLLRWIVKRPLFVFSLMRGFLFRRIRSLESLAENSWAFLVGFTLAEYIQKDGVGLLHAGWANGPTTAALIASKLTGIPYSFAGRAGDIYPPDGLLLEKARDATFIRTNNAANIPWLQKFCPQDQQDKVHLVYNSLTLKKRTQCEYLWQKPYQLLAIGRFAVKKGYSYLLTALARLKREHFPVHLTLIGDGPCRKKYIRQIKKLHIEELVDMPGFLPNDKLLEYFRNHDMFIMPSVIHTSGNRDGIPNVIMEALSNGMPVIATDVCGISEVIKNGETGILLPQRNAGAIADSIRWMSEHKERAIAMAKAGGDLVKEMFDTKKNILRLISLYSEGMKKA